LSNIILTHIIFWALVHNVRQYNIWQWDFKEVITLLQKTVKDFLKTSALKYPDKIAVIKGNSELSYNYINNKCSILAELLIRNNIGSGDRVGIFLEKSVEEVISVFGINLAGAIFVIINPKLKKEQIIHIINDCQIKTYEWLPACLSNIF